MSSIRTALMLTAATLAFAAPALADDTTQTLGTLQRTEINGNSRYYADPGSAATYTASQAVADPSVLQPQQSGNVTFVTGGVGDEEIAALEAAKKDYNLHITSASASGGAFKGNTQITIRTKKGDTLLTADSGPILLAKLPAGSYTVEATNDGKTEHRNITVGRSKSAHVHFGWQ